MTTEPHDSNPPPRPSRLRRLDRIFSRSPIYFVTAGTADRQRLLASPEIHAAFREFALAGPARGAWVGRYVLMPDHLHCFIAFDDERLQLQIWMKSLKNFLSKSFRASGIPAPHWQKGFHDHLLRGEESYAANWEYVRTNPVRAGLVRRAKEWSYAGEIFALELRPS